MANGSGAIIDRTGFLYPIFRFFGVTANVAVITTGPVWLFPVTLYTGVTPGPTSFGSGGFFAPNTDLAGIDGANGILFVPQGYVSGAALSDSMIFNNATFASLGLTPRTYRWTWGTGANQNFTLQIGAVPDSPVGLAFIAAAFPLLFAAKQGNCVVPALRPSR